MESKTEMAKLQYQNTSATFEMSLERLLIRTNQQERLKGTCLLALRESNGKAFLHHNDLQKA
jgi:hypothetical protein